MVDGRKAVRIAEWTARKDYWEFCETIEDQEDGCDRVTKAPLGPPPHTFFGDNQQMDYWLEKPESSCLPSHLAPE